MIPIWLKKLVGVRPKKLVKRCVFVDAVSLRPVNLYVDEKGRYWLAEHSLASFKVECKNPLIWLYDYEEYAEMKGKQLQ